MPKLPKVSDPKSLQALLINSQNLMLQNMSMMANATVLQREREERKKSMLSKLTKEDEALFSLLRAESC